MRYHLLARCRMEGSVRIRVKAALPGYEPGQVVRVGVDGEGTPLELFWRRRLADAARDGCCEVLSDSELEASSGADEGEC